MNDNQKWVAEHYVFQQIDMMTYYAYRLCDDGVSSGRTRYFKQGDSYGTVSVSRGKDVKVEFNYRNLPDYEDPMTGENSFRFVGKGYNTNQHYLKQAYKYEEVISRRLLGQITDFINWISTQSNFKAPC